MDFHNGNNEPSIRCKEIKEPLDKTAARDGKKLLMLFRAWIIISILKCVSSTFVKVYPLRPVTLYKIVYIIGF